MTNNTKSELSNELESFDHLAGDVRWQLSLRIAASRSFSRSPRLREFFLFAASYALDGRTSQLTELEIGKKIFGRGDDYVPSEDSVVRVSARQLRAKLKEYFETDGLGEAMLVDIPKGAYVPVFTPRAAVVSVTNSPFRWRIAFAASIAANLILLAAFVWWWGKTPQVELPAANRPNLLTAFLASGTSPVQVVISDFSVPLMRGLRPNPMTSLEAYSGWNYEAFRPEDGADPRLHRMFETLRTHRITRLGDLTIALSVERVAGRSNVHIRHARDVSVRDFKHGRHILLGNSNSTPWMELFEDRLAFVWVRDAGGVGFVNRNPKPGEQPRYSISGGQAFKEEGLGYARLALVPNIAGKDGVLLISGVNMVTMEAAGDFASDPNSVPEVLRALGVPALENLPYFELILETHAVDNTPRKAKILTSRTLGPRPR